MKFFDTHAHIGLVHDDPIDRLKVVQEAKHASVHRIVSICNSLIDFESVYDNLRNVMSVYHAVGVSPSEVKSPGQDWQKKLKTKLDLPRVVAVGETGLDYFKKYGDKRSQIELFIDQLDIASRANLPVVIHNRDAGEDLLSILHERLPKAGGILHCYSENAEYAKRALELPLYFSFAGNLTYRNAKNLHETVKILPIDRILVESESPFIPPAMFRGQRNMPANIFSTVEYMAALLDMDFEELANRLWENSCKAFNLPLED